MKHQLLIPAILAAVVTLCGCAGSSYSSQNMLSNSGTRIAPPGTGTVQYAQTQVANAPDPYYGQTPGMNATQPGLASWQSNGPAYGTPNAGGYPNANSFASPAGQAMGANSNLMVASSTTQVQSPAAPTSFASTPTYPAPGASPPDIVYGTISGGALPLNDATTMAAIPPPASNTGLYNRAAEYVAQPYAPANINPTYAPQPVYANGTIVASSSTAPTGYPPTQPATYGAVYGAPAATGYGYPTVPNAYPTNPAVADGWVQRDQPR